MFHKDRFSACIRALQKASYFLFFQIVCLHCALHAQFQDSFPPGKPLDKSWSGDVSHFSISSAGEVQLQGPGAGTSTLFRRLSFPSDSMQFSLYFRMAFAPSAENTLKVYLWTTHLDETKASGLYLTVGENGQQDAVHLWQMSQGVHKRIGSGRMGAVGLDPAVARISLTVLPGQASILSCDYTGGNWLEEEVIFNPPPILKNDSLVFGIKCTYTSSRKSSFYFDDISVLPFTRDTIPLQITSAEAVDSNKVIIRFSELPDERQVRNTGRYFVDHQIGHPDAVLYPHPSTGQATLVFSTKINSRQSYTLVTDSLPDLNGNSKSHASSFVYASLPVTGDIVISEILFYPETGGSDFVEIASVSPNYCLLDNLYISNSPLQPGVKLPAKIILPPGGYAAFTKDTDDLRQRYFPPDSAVIYTTVLPSFNATEGFVCLQSMVDNNTFILDSLDYVQDMHSPAITRRQGVSLERIHFSGGMNVPSSWHSAAAQVRYATPGYKNSSQLPESMPGAEDDFLTVYPELITPNGDGNADFTSLSIKMPRPGYIATVHIADAEGYPVITLLNNVLLGVENQFLWDGQTASGSPVQRGCYVLVCRVFHPDGDTLLAKKAMAVMR